MLNRVVDHDQTIFRRVEIRDHPATALNVKAVKSCAPVGGICAKQVHEIIAVPAIQKVTLSALSEQAVVASTAVEFINARAAGQLVGPVTARHPPAAIAGQERIIAVAAQQAVTPVTAFDPVIARLT